eukprot:TRINITY_DN12120_c0_g1_i3.p1 TRINITY_DN12120_c0_g1~~TRINITY_DN12120_c0_g1_i3.p1  ORF type:complete len:450 (+),score=106.11 TRINITY_DN12120_c0_g1_i3:649-1998(+)
MRRVPLGLRCASSRRTASASAVSRAAEVEHPEDTFTRDEVRALIRKAWEERLSGERHDVQRLLSHPHPIFQAYPLTGMKMTSLGPMPVPFQFYNSSGVVFGGTGDADAARDMLSGEDLHLVTLTDGTAPMCLWCWQHSSTSTTVGTHANSLYVFLFVTREKMAPVQASPLVHHSLWSQHLNPGVRLLPIGVWEESEQALAYNREVLGFPSLPALGYLENHTVHLKDVMNEFRRIRGFSFVDTVTGHTIAKGEAHYWDGGMRSPSTLLQLGAHLGVQESARRLLGELQDRWEHIPLVSPKSSYLPHHCDSEMVFTRNLGQLRFWNKSKPWRFEDRLLLGRTRWAALRMSPSWVWHLGGCGGAIVPPHNHNGMVEPLKLGWETEEPTFPGLPVARVPSSSRFARLPSGSPIDGPKGVAHLPHPAELERRRIQLSLQLRDLGGGGQSVAMLD